MNIDEVVRDIEDWDYRYALLSYKSKNGEEIPIELKVKTRGNRRSDPEVCSFPPIRLNFKKKGNLDNIFAGQDRLKLVTHCNSSKIFNQYVLQEYLTYKHYSVLTDYSFLVRLLKVTYIDSATNKTKYERYGFLIEDEEMLARRNGMEVHKKKILHQDFCSRSELDVLTVFQYMIGNTDWSVSAFHNIKRIFRDDSTSLPIAVPYDFDYAGAIASHYAAPHESLSITNVRQRLFRGFCRPQGEYEKTMTYFNEKKVEIYAVYENSDLLDDSNRKSMLKYFDRFYDIINNPKKIKTEINGACRIDHKHLYSKK